MSLLPPPSTTAILRRPSPYLPPIKRHVARTTIPNALRGSTGLHPFSSLSLPSDAQLLTSAVGSPSSPAPLPCWTLESKHVLLLNLTACAAAVSASWIFFSAIPAILAFRRAADSVAELLDVATEELPDTMAAVRLSGMEISDLTMELSDLGQEITQGVRSSTQAVRVAEDKLRSLTALTASVQGQGNPRNKTEELSVARTAKNLREEVVKGRAVFGFIVSMTRISRWAWNFLAARGSKRPN